MPMWSESRSYCLAFDYFPERGVRRDELRPGLRIVGFERRVTIAFHITPALVVVGPVGFAAVSPLPSPWR